MYSFDTLGFEWKPHASLLFNLEHINEERRGFKQVNKPLMIGINHLMKA